MKNKKAYMIGGAVMILILSGFLIKHFSHKTQVHVIIEVEEKQKFFINAYNLISSINKKLSEDEKIYIARCVWDVSRELKMDPYINIAVIRVESGFRSAVVGKHSEVGLFQIKPSTAKELLPITFSKKKIKRLLKNPFFNINLGATHLNNMIHRFKSTIIGIQAYNCGEGNVKKKTIPTSTKDYVIKVMEIYHKLTKTIQ